MKNLFSLIFALAFVSACSKEPTQSLDVTIDSQPPMLTVYKDPNCGCCVHWITHVEEHGYETTTVHPQDMWLVKQKLGVTGPVQSCHSAVTKDGYVFEGHVPAKFMTQFLANPPAQAIGLSVPAMVVGSPGMEVDDKFRAYQILQLNKDGSSSLYQAIDSYQQQF